MKSLLDKKKYLFFGSMLVSSTLFFFPDIEAQPAEEDKAVVLSVADRLLGNTSYEFVDAETGETVDRLTEENFSVALDHVSPNVNWTYPAGVINIAMLKLSKTLGVERFEEYVLNNYAFAFEHVPLFEPRYTGTTRKDKREYPYGHFFTWEQLDDCGAIGAGLIDAYALDPEKEYETYINRAARFIYLEQDRLYDRTFVRAWPRKWTIWGDDLYMGVSFLARMGVHSGDHQYFEDAILQVRNFYQYLYNPCTGLYYHGWYSDTRDNSLAHWGRVNGWILMAQVELLDHLPEDYPGREELLRLLRHHIIGLARHQDVTGVWHQVLDRYDSFFETSCTAMFIYGIAKAVRKGWIDRGYMQVALQGWDGLKEYIDEDGSVHNICPGTGIARTLGNYYRRPALTDELHGLGPVLLAGDEILRHHQK